MRRLMIIPTAAALSVHVGGCAGTYGEVVRTERVVNEVRLNPTELAEEGGGDNSEIVVERKDGVRLTWPRGAMTRRLTDGFEVRSETAIGSYTNEEVAAVTLRQWKDVEVRDRVRQTSSIDTGVTIGLVVLGVAAMGLAIAHAQGDLGGIGGGVGALGGWSLGNIGGITY